MDDSDGEVVGTGNRGASSTLASCKAAAGVRAFLRASSALLAWDI